MRTFHSAKLAGAGISVSLGLVLSACAGGVQTGGTAEGPSVEYGAGPDAYAEALADIQPIELTYQPAAPSVDSPTGRKEQHFADAIEEASDGKITVNVEWGNPITDLGTAADALADGRLDIAYHVPVYNPSTYPAISQLENLGPTMTPSPYMSGMVNQAAMNSVAWNTEEVRAEYESKGLGLLIPTDVEFDNGIVCTDPISSIDDFKGLQVRVGSSVDRQILEDLGASPVTLQSTELYEGLQRGVVDCMQAHVKNATLFGAVEIAPHFAYPVENSFTRSPGALLTGINVQSMPLAVQQLIFDQVPVMLAGQVTEYLEYIKDVGESVKAADGTISTLPPQVDKSIGETAESLREDVKESSNFDGPAVVARYDDAVDKWSQVADSLGYEDHGKTLQELSEYLQTNQIDPQSFVDAYFEEVFVPHRPS